MGKGDYKGGLGLVHETIAAIIRQAGGAKPGNQGDRQGRIGITFVRRPR